jgi:hypothetical protein
MLRAWKQRVALILVIGCGCAIALSMTKNAAGALKILPVQREKVESVENILQMTLAITNDTVFTLCGEVGELCADTNVMRDSSLSGFWPIMDPGSFCLKAGEGQLLSVYVAEHGPWLLAGRYRRTTGAAELRARALFRRWGLPVSSDAPYHFINRVCIKE